MDYLSLKAAVAEINREFSGARITDAWQTGRSGVVLVPRRGKVLLLSADPVRPGLFLLDQDQYPERAPSPFTDLLQNRIKGTILVKIQLPEAGERLASIKFASVWPARENTPFDIMVEVMGRRSNIMVLEGGKILYPLRVVPKEKSPARPVTPGRTYTPPPVRAGTALEDISAEVLAAWDPAEGPDEIVKTVRGLSPYTARQAILKCGSRAREGSDESILAGVLREMVSVCTGDTGYLHRSGGRIHLTPFQPVFEDPSDEIEQHSPFSEAAVLWRRLDASDTVGPGAESAALGKRLSESIKRINAALKQVDREEERCSAHNEIRAMAEALLIHAAEVDPRAETVVLPDPYDPAIRLTIDLDPARNPHEVANDLFSKARRQRRGLQEVAARREKLEQEKKEIQAASEALTDLDDPEPAKRILELTSPDKVSTGKAKQYSYDGPGRRHTIDGFTILVGKSSTDNEKVTFKAAGPGDMWLHARDYPGSHVVILTGKKKVPDTVLYEAAALAAKGSGAKNDSAPEIMVTERKWVKKLKGGKPGQVTVEKFRTIRPRM